MTEILTITLAWENGRSRVAGVTTTQNVAPVEPVFQAAPAPAQMTQIPKPPPVVKSKSERAAELLAVRTHALDQRYADLRRQQRTPERHAAILIGLQRGLKPRQIWRIVDALPAERRISYSAFELFLEWAKSAPPPDPMPVFDEAIFVQQPKLEPKPKPKPVSLSSRRPEICTPERREKLLSMLRDGKSRSVILRELNREGYGGAPVRETALGEWIRRLRQEGVAPPGPGSAVIKGKGPEVPAKPGVSLDEVLDQLPAENRSRVEERARKLIAEKPPQSVLDRPIKSGRGQEQPPLPDTAPEPYEAVSVPESEPPPFSAGHAAANGGIPRLVPRMPSPGVMVKYYKIGEARAWAAHWGMPGWTIASYEQINAYCQRKNKPYEFRDPVTERAA